MRRGGLWRCSAGMPELPEVETTRRHIASALIGRTIDRVVVSGERTLRRQERRPDFRGRLIGRTVENVGRHGKFLVIDLDDDLSWVVHLGMSGRLALDDPGEPLAVHTRFVVGFDRRGRLEVSSGDARARHVERRRALLAAALWVPGLSLAQDDDSGDDDAFRELPEPTLPDLSEPFDVLVTGIGVKAALVPLHGWLPRAMIAPAPTSWTPMLASPLKSATAIKPQRPATPWTEMAPTGSSTRSRSNMSTEPTTMPPATARSLAEDPATTVEPPAGEPSAEELQAKLKLLPDAPGVYLHKNKQGKVIYVGKANRLNQRVRSYFRDNVEDEKTRALVRKIHDRPTTENKPRFIGMDVEDKYIFGCGMDAYEHWRHLDEIRALEEGE